MNSDEELPEVTGKRFSLKQFKESLRIFSFIRPYRSWFIVGLIFLVLSSLTNMIFPFITGKLVGAATDSKSWMNFNINDIALVMGSVLIFQSIFSYFRVYLFSYVTEKASADIRFQLYSKIINLPVTYFDQHRVGELNSRLTNDVAQLQDMLGSTLAELYRQIASLVVGIIIILFISPKLTLFMIATFPVMVIIALIFGRYVRKLSKNKQDELARANVIVEETLQAIKVVKAFTNEVFETFRYRTALDKSVILAMKGAKYRAAFISFIIFALFGGIVLVLWYGVILVQQQELSVANLISFIIYTMFIGAAVGGLGDLYSQLQKTVGSSERILEILDEEVESYTQNSTAQEVEGGDISFKNVGFTYPSRQDVTVLDSVNLTIGKGEKIALVGPSGAGKSTIAQLLLRFYETSEGTIEIGGVNINDIPLERLRKMIGIVPQETLLFGGTIRENILYGKPDASNEEIEEAAKKANALNFILTFPDGLETIVGERGIQLSGGQRQRVAIARAILKDPEILILDEATSSLDSESERQVQEALDQLMEGRTSLIIAHRLSTVKKADKILVINGGKIVENGSHQELIEKTNGLYSHLVAMQLN